MNQCVPSWCLDEHPLPNKLSLRSSHSNTSASPDVPMLDYEVAELTWENGQLAMHGLGPPRTPAKLTPSSTNFPSKYTWEKPRASGTLESIVNQATATATATCLPEHKQTLVNVGQDNLVPWFDDHNHSHHRTSAAVSTVVTKDALVPCTNRTEDPATCVVGCSTRVGSCSAPSATGDEEGKPERVARVEAAPPEWSNRDQSVSGSANTIGRDSQHLTLDTYERELGGGFTSTSMGSHENTKTVATADENDSVCHSKPQRVTGDEEEKTGNWKSTVSTKRSRAAAIHNQSERKRRDKINQRMKTLQKLVPNSSKTDKASILDEVIDYLKQLQAQVQMMSRMNMQPMMLPMAMQQQLQLSMMTPMSLGVGMGMGMGVMDMNTIAARSNIPGMSHVLHPTAFMPLTTSWEGSADRLQAAASTSVMPDPLSTFIACQPQPMTMDAYSRLAAMYQQLQQQQQQQQPPASNFKS